MVNGSIVALVTPMHDDGSIDRDALANLIEWHIDAKTSGIIIGGTTGEAATLNDIERQHLLTTAIDIAANRIPIIAGTGTQATAHTIELTRAAHHAGAAAALIVTPYYNKPTQAGLIAHYQKIAKTVSIPIVLYNVPGRTACDLLPETITTLARIPNIIGIKEASGKIERITEIKQATPDDFLIYSGEDSANLEIMRRGAHGCMSVTANVAPHDMQQFCAAALAHDDITAARIHDKLMPLHQTLFVQSNPIPTKWALHLLGRISPGLRLPLLPLEEKYQPTVKQALEKAGVM